MQLYLAIGIPSALLALNVLGVLAGFFWQAKRYEDMSKRFDDVGRRFGDMGKRLDGMGNRFDDMGKRFDDMGKRLDDLKEVVRADLSRVEGVLSAKIDGLDTRVKALEDSQHSLLVKR